MPEESPGSETPGLSYLIRTRKSVTIPRIIAAKKVILIAFTMLRAKNTPPSQKYHQALAETLRSLLRRTTHRHRHHWYIESRLLEVSESKLMTIETNAFGGSVGVDIAILESYTVSVFQRGKIEFCRFFEGFCRFKTQQ